MLEGATRRPPSKLLAVTVSAALSVGCGGPDGPSGVEVVLESDLGVPVPVGGMFLHWVTGDSPISSGPGFGMPAPEFPARLLFRSIAGRAPMLNVNVQLVTDTNFPSPNIVLSRSLLDVQLVEHRWFTVTVPLLSKCACQGTACPNPGDADCDDLISPPLSPFDTTGAAPSSRIFDLD